MIAAVNCKVNKQYSVVLLLLLLSACGKPVATNAPNVASESSNTDKGSFYAVLARLPDDTLDQLQAQYPGSFDAFRSAWIENASASPLDGQRAIELLEIACYADVTCHPIEYPLRVATLEYLEANMKTSGVLDALQWVRHSYKSGLPLDTPGDDTGQMRGIVVESMNIRMHEYSENLLNPQAPSQHRK